MRIHKYKIEKVEGPQLIRMPLGARPIQFGVQTDPRGSNLFVWAIVDPAEVEEQGNFIQVVGTGRDIPVNSLYIDTVIDGPFVWHLFQLIDYVAEPAG